MKKINIVLTIFIAAFLFSCSEDFLDQSPSSSQLPEEINSLQEVELLVRGTYNSLQSADYYNGSFIMKNDVRADDMGLINGSRLDDEYDFDYDANSFDSDMWKVLFTAIRKANSCLYFLDKITVEKEEDIEKKQELIGHARALRALFHFDLARIFAKQYPLAGDADLGIPIVEEVLGEYDFLQRNTVKETYQFIVDEFEAAIPMLGTSRKDGFLNAYGVKALLSRVYLYMENNPKAYELATDVIENSPYKLIINKEYVNSWSSTSTSESILSVINSAEDNGGGESVANISDPDSYGSFGSAKSFVSFMSADVNDVRYNLLQESKSSKRPNGRVLKYPGIGNTLSVVEAYLKGDGPLNSATNTSSVPVIRLSEVYLIAAEAAVKNNDKPNAIKYLNPIVERGNPANTVAEADVNLDRVLEERRKELVAEGHRFFDLIRNKRNIVRETKTVLEYTDDLAVFPIPQEEMNVNGDHMIQNSGY